MLLAVPTGKIAIGVGLANQPPRDLADGTITSGNSDDIATFPKRLFPIFFF